MNDLVAAVSIIAGIGFGAYALNHIIEGGKLNPTLYSNAVMAVDCQKVFKSQGAQCLCIGVQIGTKAQFQNSQLPVGRR